MTRGHVSGPDRGEPPLPGDLAAAVRLGGQMGRRFAEFDWAAHPLGRPGGWPAEWRSAVAVALTSRFPIVLWLGAEDLFVVYNDGYIQILADKHPAALGQRGRDVWWDIWEPISPMLASVAATGEATWSHDLMLPMITAGRREERYFTFTYSPLIADDGEISGIFCPSFETTERVLSERRLHLLNTVASATMETQTIDDAVSVTVAVCATQPADLPFVAAYVGDSETGDITLRGATASTLPLLPRSLAELTDWDPALRSRTEVQIIDDVAGTIPGIGDIFADDCPEQALVLPLGEGSTTGALVLGTSPRRPLDTQYRGFCQLLADQLSSALASAVSYEHQRQRADALAELDRAKTAFLTNISHEFRTPLTLLLGPLDDALSDAVPGTVLADRLTTARRSAERLLRLVNSLLDFSRVQAGRVTADPVCTDIGALTESIASSFTELCDRAGLDLVIDCHPVLADVDPAMWETIVLNLLSNAVKYTLQGAVSVEVRGESSAECSLTVRDTGVGIGEADRERLFERFFRADNVRGRSAEGTGIGLSLIRGLIELHHGTLAIDSELDRGTTVTVRVPRSPEGTPAHAPAGRVDQADPYVTEASQWLESVSTEQSGEVVRATGRRELVLVADDNADMRAHLKRVLSARWDTALVADGESALQAARDLRPDAIVTDVMMPALGGYELVAAIRADPALASTPIVMLSARPGAEAVSEGIAGGADDYLPKPFSSRELVDLLAARLSAAAHEHASRQHSDAATRRTSALMQLDTALQSAGSVDGILSALMDFPMGLAGAGAVAVGVLDSEEDTLRVEYAGDVPAELRDRYHVTTLDAPLVVCDVVKSDEPMIIADTFSLPARYQHAVLDTASAVRASIVHPLHGNAGRVIGVLVLLWPAPQRFATANLELFVRIAESTQSALDRVRVTAREHRIAVDFQEHLLDLDPRSTAAVVAGVYQPAGEAMRVGGDWYLVAPLGRPGAIGISVGDVVGHGLPAAIVMSRLRAALAATALTEADPAAVLTVLDGYAATVPGAHCATVSYAVLETETETGAADAETETGAADADGPTATISYICAGHPYPLLVSPDGRADFLESGRRPPVAAWKNKATDKPAQVALPPGSLILFYTDGLIERPGETLDQGFARLRLAAADCADLPVGVLCTELLDRMRPRGGYTDDVVILALRPNHSAARSFATVLPAASDQLPAVRDWLRRWLAQVGVDPLRQHDIVLATGEAITNAVEHGSHSDPDKTVSVEAFLRGDTVTVAVADSGRWSGDSAASLRSDRRGRGLILINGLADHVDTVRTPHGTQITLRFDHAVPAAVGPADEIRR